VLGAVDGKYIDIVILQTLVHIAVIVSVLLMAVVKESNEFVLADFEVNGCISDGGVLECTEFYNVLTYLLHGAESILRSKTVSLPVPKFPTFYGTRRFITAFTSARHLSLS
jgi:hypothetical protein